MKCIKQIATDKIVRTNDRAAILMVSAGDWKYISKEEWKMKVRDSQPNNKESEYGKRQKDLSSS
jgi:hypothetical protein